ncbi:MAG: chloride channel protein [Bdellovibrio sp. CG10_big_fil_rev_8_21_14_0_10_47_8]|nr:MAG: chloride channel protein [Bdellovibrio sp. CG10_big_fil_rev_8_21_14_0_10_47_8]
MQAPRPSKLNSSDHDANLPRRHQGRLCLAAVAIGIASYFIAIFLLSSISFFTQLFYFQRISFESVSPDPHYLGIYSILVPMIGGLIVGLMAKFGSAAIRGHGIPEAMEKILLDESKIPARVLFLKPISSAIAIGSGGPFGAEGPIIATGGALGSLCGQILPLTKFERKILLSCGAAAGMTAIFGTPLAAVLLAIELLLFEFRAQSFIPVALSAVVAAVMRSTFLTTEPFFEMPTMAAVSLAQLPIYLLSGIAFGLLSIFITKSVYLIEDLFDRLPIHWMWWPMLGGIGIGVIGLIEPKSLGVGYSNIGAGLAGNIPVAVALALGFWKFCSWVIALSSGTSGGTLAPLLTFGALSGYAFGVACNAIPGVNIDVHVTALIGMAAVFAGCSRALFASVIFALETTQQPLGIVPLLGACAVSYLVSHWFMKTSIMTEKIVRRGVRVPTDYFPLRSQD